MDARHSGEFVNWDMIGQVPWASVATVLRGLDVYDPRNGPFLRRFCCRCCRAHKRHLPDESLAALETIERFCDGKASFDELVQARDAAKLSARRVGMFRAEHLHAVLRLRKIFRADH